MRNKKLKIMTLTLSLMLIISVFAVGCTTTQQRTVPDRYGTTGDTTRYGTMYDTTNPYNYGQNYNGDNKLYGFYNAQDKRSGLGNYNQNQSQNLGTIVNTSTNSEQVRQMESTCNQVEGVKDTDVIKRGNTAYIACDTTENVKNEAALRAEFANKIRNIDPSVNKIIVTVDKDKVSKFRDMVNNVNLGKTTTNFMTDLENLFR